MTSQRVEFRTFDGTLLRGDFYKAEKPNAGIVIMTQGLSLLKEHFIDDFARRFQQAGISALLYDHRGWGSSEGTPRFQTNPIQQAEDYHDAITFVTTLQPRGMSRIAIWGIGHSGGASMIAANDPRLSAVVLVMPFTSGAADSAAFPPETLENAWADREASAKAWSESDVAPETKYVNLWPESKENAEGRGPQHFLTGLAAYNFITEARSRSDRAGTPSNNKLSLQSFFYISNIEPRDYIRKISPCPLLYLAAATDALTGSVEGHKKVFENAREPKEFVVLNNHHLANYFGQSFEENVSAQIKFLEKYL